MYELILQHPQVLDTTTGQVARTSHIHLTEEHAMRAMRESIERVRAQASRGSYREVHPVTENGAIGVTIWSRLGFSLLVATIRPISVDELAPGSLPSADPSGAVIDRAGW